VPICAHNRICSLGEVDALRRAVPGRISWVSLFLKAYGLMAQETPQFRQSCLPHPLASIYEHDTSVGMVAVAREFRDEPWLFWGRIISPQTQSLSDIQRRLEEYQTLPVERVFRNQLHLSALPTPLRRILWWWNLAVSGRTRARRTGTFFLTTLAGKGAEISNPPSFHTGNITYGPMDENGVMRITLSYDHRIMDGFTVADALRIIEEKLTGPIAAELRELAAAASDQQQLKAA